jgi:OOP family OmpA-OmpF porin
MNKSSQLEDDNTLPSDSNQADQDGIAELRQLILGPMESQVGHLQERLDNPRLHAQDISSVLPEAIVQRAGQDKKLATALMPTVEDILRLSIKKDLKSFADALFPVIGPAIRKAIAEALRSMIQSLNETLERSFSWEGLKWRMEALKTKRSFAEVALIHSIAYRVEQVFLIHKKTGLLLAHVVGPQVVGEDADMISGMLTAIKDFVADSFKLKESDSLENIRVGELSVWIEEGPEAILAGVIRGQAPESIRVIFKDALENIHLIASDALAGFNGDVSFFDAVQPNLELCLLTQYKQKQKKLSPLLFVLAGIVVVLLGSWVTLSIREQVRWEAYLRKLTAEPGLVVTTAQKRQGKYFIAGLRDPLAVEPLNLLKESKIEADKVVFHWEPYYAVSGQFVLQRAQRVLNPPAGVSLSYDDGTLSATGAADHQWIVASRKLAGVLPGVMRFQEDGLVDTDMQELQSIQKTIEQQMILFPLDSSDLAPGQSETLQKLKLNLQKLREVGKLVGRLVHIKIIGYADKSGSKPRNQRLSLERAKKISSYLIAQGILPSELSPVGMGVAEPVPGAEKDKKESHLKDINRRVSFKVIVQDLGK